MGHSAPGSVEPNAKAPNAYLGTAEWRRAAGRVRLLLLLLLLLLSGLLLLLLLPQLGPHRVWPALINEPMNLAVNGRCIACVGHAVDRNLRVAAAAECSAYVVATSAAAAQGALALSSS
jgi:hypothetical protein